MKIRTFFHLILLLSALSFVSCKSTSPGSTSGDVATAEKSIAKKRKKEAKTAKREMRKAKKAFWKNQSKTARKRVKKSNRLQRKQIRKMRNEGTYDYQKQDRWVNFGN